MKTKQVLYELIIYNHGSASLIDKVNNKTHDFKFKLQRAWQLKMYLEENEFVNIPWDCMEFTEERDVINDYNFVSEPYTEPKTVIEITKKKKPLTINERVNILQHEFTSGRWGQNLASAVMNSEKDYVILNRYEHEIDYMFSESVSSDYWIYNIKSMKEYKIDKVDLSYSYMHCHAGRQENGIYSVNFSKNNPYELEVVLSDNLGGKGENMSLLLPQN